MLEMAEKEVDSTTEEVATPIKKTKVERKKNLSAQAKINLAKERAKEVFDNISGNKPPRLRARALRNCIYIQ